MAVDDLSIDTKKLDDQPALAHFLQTEPTATIAVPVDQNGTIHAATLLFSHTTNPLRFYFVTSRKTEKCRLLTTQPSVPAACVVGTHRDTTFTLQMRGNLRIVSKEQYQSQIDAYYQKRGNSNDDVIDPDNVFLEFTPTWARYTDYTDNYKKHYLKV